MDRRVKERLVGATILVVLLVLIVPELLSGPKHAVPATPSALPSSENTETMRSVTVDLTTRQATADAASATASDAVSNAGGPASAADTPSAAPTITTLKAQQPSVAPPPVENEDPPPTSRAPAKPMYREAPHAGWAVQLGSFASRANADSLLRQLKGHDAPGYVLSSGKGGDLRYKVRVGPFADRAAADRARLKLAQAGHPGSLVAP